MGVRQSLVELIELEVALAASAARTSLSLVLAERWSHFLRQPVKVDLTMQRMIHHENAETVFG